jgi:hypothetical protein
MRKRNGKPDLKRGNKTFLPRNKARETKNTANRMLPQQARAKYEVYETYTYLACADVRCVACPAADLAAASSLCHSEL